MLAHVRIVVHDEHARPFAIHGARSRSRAEVVEHRCRNVGRFSRRQPPQGLLDEGFGPDGGRGKQARSVHAVGGQVVPTERDSHDESGANSDVAFDPNFAMVQSHQFLHERETDARALVGVRPRCPSTR